MTGNNMATSSGLYIASYDISDNRIRTRVAKALSQYGVRVQASVFELRCSTGNLEQLVDRLVRILDSGDSLRVYPVPEMARRQAIVLGGMPISEPGPYWIV